MAVDDVVMNAFFNCKSLNALNKFRDITGKFLLGKRVFRSGRDMDNPVAVSQLMQNMGNMIILGAREDIHMDAHLA